MKCSIVIFNILEKISATVKSLQSCPTLCDSIDGSPPGFPVPRILQARTLEWVAISFSNAWRWKVKVKSVSRVQLLATPWTAAYKAPPIHGISQARALEWGAIAFSNAWKWGCYFYLRYFFYYFVFKNNLSFILMHTKVYNVLVKYKEYWTK